MLAPNARAIIARLSGPRGNEGIKGKPGLRLFIRGDGNGSWRLKYRLRPGETQRWHTLTNDARNTPPGEVFAKARELLTSIKVGGVDPKREVRRQPTFDDLVRRWIDTHGKQHKRSWARDLALYDRLLQPRMGALRASAVTRGDIVAVLDDLAANVGPVQANRAQALISAAFAWAMDEGLVAAHPSYRLRKRGKETVRDRHLSDDELRSLWRGLDTVPRHIGDALRLLLITGQRRSEVGGMTTAELSSGSGPVTWTIPAVRVKNKLEHSVPITPMAAAIIARQTTKGGFVFPSRRVIPAPIEGSTLSARFADLVRVLQIEGVRLHDLRHTVKTRLAQIGVPDSISDRVTNQITGQRARVGSRYDHHSYADEKRRALELWERRLLAIVEGSDPPPERW